MSSNCVERAALGRVAKLGALYDIRSDSFLADTVFASKLDDGMIDVMGLDETLIELVMDDSIQDKCNKLDIQSELQLSVLTGLVKCKGSGAYIREEKKSARDQTMSLIYKKKTFNEEIMLRQNREKIDKDNLSSLVQQSSDATHVVVGIDWGAACAITCQYENMKNEESTVVNGYLTAEIQKLKGLIDAEPGGSRKRLGTKKDDKQRSKFTFNCKADVSAAGKDLPCTFEGAVEFAKSLPTLVEKINNGKGVPLTYKLMPLNAVVKMCKSQEQLDIQFKEVDDGTIIKCGQVLEAISEKRQAAYDVHYELHANKEYVLDQSIKKIDKIVRKLAVEETCFRQGLQEVVKRVRSGQNEISAIERFIERLPETMTKCYEELEVFQKDIEHLHLINEWKSRGIKHIGRNGTLSTNNQPTVVVFYRIENSGTTRRELERNQEFFLRLQATHSNNPKFEFIVVDRHLRKNSWWPSDIKKPTIHKFLKGSLKSTDLYGAEGKDTEMCLIKIGRASKYRTHQILLADIHLRCPNALFGNNSQCCGESTYWRCSKCKTIVEYGINTKMFYCKCGKSNPTLAKFRCNDMRHNMNYVKYPTENLKTELRHQEQRKEINILIIGETGVGKSTWINAFQNCLYFAHLEEAMQSDEFRVLIPSSFTFTREGEQKQIRVGEPNQNEVLEVGKSATKQPQTYVFNAGGVKVRLIDTPGIADCEGTDQDKINVESILSYLSHYDTIHAVCILIKPNKSRSSVIFRYCIQEMLLQLHSSAKNNILFCFTNTRATFYEPGDTLPILQKELRERDIGIEATPSNYFCFDSEAFRLLACVKNGVKFDKSDVETYSASWKRSLEETKRLLMSAESLEPHKIRDTMSMNEARRVILAISKPLAQIAKTIEENKVEAEKVKGKIDKADDVLKYIDKLAFVGYDNIFVALASPRTVCTHPDCIDIVPVGISQNVRYRQICHHNCTCVSGISTQTVNDRQLQNCISMTNGKCKECGHPVDNHMHMTYDTQKVIREFFSTSELWEISGMRMKKKLRMETKIGAKKIKTAIDDKISEMKEEEEIVMNTAAEYASFLKATAILIYNDAVEEYLQMSIKVERFKPTETRNNALVETLQEMILDYQKQKQTLNDAINKETGENIPSPDEIMKKREVLFKLRHFGPTLKALFKDISITNSARNVAFKEVLAPMRLLPSPSKDKEQKGWLQILDVWNWKK